MITKQSFPYLLQSLGFTEQKNIYSKKFESGAELKVDIAAEKLIYPKELQADRDTTKNFSQPENFVVFECVHNLLAAGYKPEHIILEKGLYGGHGMTGGFADIIVQDNDKNPYLLIECKTADDGKSKEFSVHGRKCKKTAVNYLATTPTMVKLAGYVCMLRIFTMTKLNRLIT